MLLMHNMDFKLINIILNLNLLPVMLKLSQCFVMKEQVLLICAHVHFLCLYYTPPPSSVVSCIPVHREQTIYSHHVL